MKSLARGIAAVAAILTMAVTAVSCNQVTTRDDHANDDAVEMADSIEADHRDLTQLARQWADSVTSTLTLRQKAAQMIMPAIYSSDDVWTLRKACEYGDSCIGGVVLLKGDVAGARSVAESLEKESKVPPFVAVDAEWGLAMRLADAARYPTNAELGEYADEQMMYGYGRQLAAECRRAGINMVLGPVVDVAGRGGFLGKRSYGPDAHRVADLAVAYAKGLESSGVLSVAKHFPGHGAAAADSHRTKPLVRRSLHQLDSIDLYPFRQWIDQGLSAIMVGHMAVPAVDPGMLPAAVSPAVITDLLRGDMGFRGLVLTDALNMKGAEGHTALEALLAGADIVVSPADTRREIDTITAAVARARVSPQTIDDRVRRILFHKYLMMAK